MTTAPNEPKALTCYDCGRVITGGVVWLAEDYRRDGGDIEGPHPFHASCADQPWPLYEVTAEEAAKLAEEKRCQQS